MLLGDETLLTFTVSNPGSGKATGVVLAEHIPAGLKHPGGSELEYTVGDLKPGESRQLQLRLKAVQAGTIANVITARADANLRAQHRFNLEVISPQLDVALAGPKRRYLGARPPTSCRFPIPARPRPSRSSWWPICRRA